MWSSIVNQNLVFPRTTGSFTPKVPTSWSRPSLYDSQCSHYSLTQKKNYNYHMVSCNQWLPIRLVNFVSPSSPQLPSILKLSSAQLPSLVSKPCSSITVLHRGKSSTLQRRFTGASTEPSLHISIVSFRQTRRSSSGKLHLKRPRTEYHEQSFATKLWTCLLPSTRMLQAPGPFIRAYKTALNRR